MTKVTQHQIDLYNAAKQRERRGSVHLYPSDFSDAKRVETEFGYANVARYIVLRKGENIVTRYEAFLACFAGKLDKESLKFDLVTQACINFEATYMFMRDEAYGAAVAMLNERRKHDEGFQNFMGGLSSVTGAAG